VPAPASDQIGLAGSAELALGGGAGARTNWAGVFTEAQAARGQQAYAQACAACHEEDLLGGGFGPALVGQPFRDRWDGQTVHDMVQTIRRTMPQEAPDSLGTQAYVDIVSYLLRMNESPAGSRELPLEPERLREVLVTSRP
jgi:S-disulfanyl-L-cysteine oxidoreductase SoxD